MSTFELLTLLTLALYALSWGKLLFTLKQADQSRTFCFNVLAVASVLHAGLLGHVLFAPEGMSLGLSNLSSLMGWWSVLLLLLSSTRQPTFILSLVLTPLAALGLSAMFFWPDQANSYIGYDLASHILTSILAYTILSLAIAQALTWIWLNSQLKSKQFNTLANQLPPLQVMENLFFKMIRVGFAFLSLSILTGFLFLDDMFAQHVVHKTLLSLLAWLMFLGLIIGQNHYGLRGQKAVRIAMGGFIILALGFLGSKLVIERLVS